MISPQEALIRVMVLSSLADAEMKPEELGSIGDMVRHLPVFEGFDTEKLTEVAESVLSLLDQEDGIDVLLNEVTAALPNHLRETAYALACDVVAADREARQEELRLLEMIRHRLPVERLAAAAIERGARARYQKL